jgi:hypothetical protein
MVGVDTGASLLRGSDYELERNVEHRRKKNGILRGVFMYASDR